MCDKIARIVPIRQINGLPTVPVSSDPRNGDWIDTDIFIGEFAMDVNTGFVYTRSAMGITGVSAETGQFIPLSGTEVGSPVTGDIEMDVVYPFTIGYNDEIDDSGIFKELGDIIFISTPAGITAYNTVTNFSGQLSIGEEFFTLSTNNPDFKGFVGNNYFGANYTDNTYVQKKYVDNAMIPLDYGDTKNVGGIENVQVYTTGTGTGTSSVDLSPTMAIGKDVTVSDLGNNASTHNINVDSGLGNTILYNGVASQDITLNTDGASVTIRKMTANQFMVIAKN